MRGTRWHSWLRHCATSRKVVGSILDGVNGIFYWHNPSGRTMALGLTQPLTEMSTRNISWGVKVASAYGWQPYHLQVLTVLKSGSLNLLEPSGPVQACNGIVLLFLHVLATTASHYLAFYKLWYMKNYTILHKKEFSPFTWKIHYRCKNHLNTYKMWRIICLEWLHIYKYLI